MSDLPRWEHAAARLEGYFEKWKERLHTDPETGLIFGASSDDSGSPPLSIEKLAFQTGRGLEVGLRIFAPSMVALFAFSSLIPSPLLGQLLRTCSIAGLIGFGTNWMAIKMLFRPQGIRPIFGQGLIPQQRDEILRKVADEITSKLVNEHTIQQELDESQLITRLTNETVRELRRIVRDPEFIADTKTIVSSFAAELVRSPEFGDEMSRRVEARIQKLAGKTMGGWLIDHVRGVWRKPLVRFVDSELADLPETLDRVVGGVDEVLDNVPAFLSEKQTEIDAALTRVVMGLIREIDLRQVILKQLGSITNDQLEVGFREFADDKLSYITLLGGMLGMVGGVIIVWPIASMLTLCAAGLMVAAVDVVVHRLLQRRSRRLKAHDRENAS